MYNKHLSYVQNEIMFFKSFNKIYYVLRKIFHGNNKNLHMQIYKQKKKNLLINL